MIGLPIGLSPIGGDYVSFSTILNPNIFLSGTLDFGYPFRIPNRITTYLNYGVIVGDDNVIQVNLTNTITSQPITPKSCAVNIYAPGTDSPAVITKTGTIITGGFQFALSHTDVEDLIAGNYPWIGVVTLQDSSRHTVNCGDINLTTGLMRVVERP